MIMLRIIADQRHRQHRQIMRRCIMLRIRQAGGIHKMAVRQAELYCALAFSIICGEIFFRNHPAFRPAYHGGIVARLRDQRRGSGLPPSHAAPTLTNMRYPSCFRRGAR